MQGDLLLVVLVLIVGCGAFVFGVLYFLCSVLGMASRGLARLVRSPRPESRAAGGFSAYRIRVTTCRRCGNPEHRPARFCSQCGTRMGM